MTPNEFRTIRWALGLSGARMADLIGLGTVRTVRRYESGETEIPGPVALLLHMITDVPPARRYAEGRKIDRVVARDCAPAGDGAQLP